MICPSCTDSGSKVLESRISDAGDTTRRRRECLACGARFTTYERVEQTPLRIRKSDGRTQNFSCSKLMRGLAIACSKRDIRTEQLERLVREVETALREDNRSEVSSREVGEHALAGLVRIDEAAAIRFASVIQGAESLHGFRQLLDRMESVVT